MIIADQRPDKEASFIALIARLKHQRLMDKSTGLDGEILRAIRDLSNFIEYGQLAVKRIADSINGDRSERMKITPQRIGRRLKALGFETGRTVTGASALLYDDRKLAQLLLAYGLEETSVTPETPERPAVELEQSEITDLTDDSSDSDDPELFS
jgi:hypothetical protein